jgi:hypothetical protein
MSGSLYVSPLAAHISAWSQAAGYVQGALAGCRQKVSVAKGVKHPLRCSNINSLRNSEQQQ